ncbi:MAG: SOS response-associated peptidase [Xanthomonadales bacterium]|nr:SOS response-associated peptidase [Xanthomonadales bacterium]
MCGRDTFFRTWEEVWRFSQPIDVLFPEQPPAPQYNRAPTQQGWIIVPEDDHGRIHGARWGLIPHWAKADSLPYATFNARVESVSSKPAFRDAFRGQRCLVPSSGYYEWKVLEDGSKQPYFIFPEAPLMHFAGLFSERIDADGAPRFSYTILTQPASTRLTPVHDRQPVILRPDEFAAWMTGDRERATALIEAERVPDVQFHRVSKAVGSSRSQGPQLIEPLRNDEEDVPPGANRSLW